MTWKNKKKVSTWKGTKGALWKNTEEKQNRILNAVTYLYNGTYSWEKMNTECDLL